MNAINEAAMAIMISLMTQFGADNHMKIDQQELWCLSQNIYFEARAEGVEGKAAVANVTRNRVVSKDFPNTYCGVVYQGPVRESWKTKQNPDLDDDQRVYYPRKHRCQFSWYCDGKSDKMYDNDAFWRAVEISNLVLEAATGKYPLVDITEGSTHYHTIEVAPDWRHDRGMMKISRIGDHIFYRWEIL